MESAMHCKLDPLLCAVHEDQIQPSDGVEVIGGYLKDEKLYWLAKDSLLKVINHGSKRCLSSTTFLHSNEEISLKITTCKKYDANHVIVGLRSDDGKGRVCLLNFTKNRIEKAIEIPFSVTSLELILNDGGATLSSKAFAQNLRWFFGLVAVGTEEGHVYLLDLRTDDKEAPILNETAMMEAIPTVVKDIPLIRDSIHHKASHIAFELLESCFENNYFYFTGPDDRIIESYDCNDVCITALYFERRSTSLFIGYSFGQFHIYDLSMLMLSHSSNCGDTDPVVDFAFQEPENDPRNCCYLWVVKTSNNHHANEENVLFALMFQIVFQQKDIVTHQNGFISQYQQLENCALQYELVLDPALGTTPMTAKSQLLQCSVIESYPKLHNLNEEESEYCSTPFTSLFVIAWQSLTSSSQNTQVLFFDINCWYNAHMPRCYRDLVEDHTYIAIWEVDSIISHTPTSQLMSFYTPPSSLQPFRLKFQSPVEQFSRPSAFSCTTYILTDKEALTCKMNGIQRQIIGYLMESRSDCLMEPEVYHQMVDVGLIEQLGGTNNTEERKKEKILSAALDCGFFGFISRVIADLASGEHAAEGCTLRFIMDWAWKRVSIIKDSFDDLCTPIFDCSTITLDSETHSLLNRFQSQLADLIDVFKSLSHEAKNSSEQSMIELTGRQNVVQLIHTYIKVLRWFVDAAILPEQLEGHLSHEMRHYQTFHFVYKYSTLRMMYEKARKDYNTKSLGKGMLMIDKMIDEAGESLKESWKTQDQNKVGIYPPPSILSLLDMYYLDSMSTPSKHSIVTYFLLDVLAVEETSEDDHEFSDIYKSSLYDHKQTCGFFPVIFQLPTSTTNLIKAYWMLDHKEFQESLSLLCDAGTDNNLEPHQHQQILVAYMSHGHCDLALKYLLTLQPICSSVDDVKLKIEIYIKNGLVQHALEVAKSNVDTLYHEDIYFHLFSCCYHNSLFQALLKIPINAFEDTLLCKYLSSGSIPSAHNLLVLYHLQKSRYKEGIQAFQQSKPFYIMVERNDHVKQHHETLRHIVQGYINILPEVERELISVKNKAFERNKIVKKQVVEVRPLSATLNSRAELPLSHSALFSLTFDKCKKPLHKPSMTPFRKRTDVHTALYATPQQKKLFFTNDVTSSATVSSFISRSEDRRKNRNSFNQESPMLKKKSSRLSVQQSSPVCKVNERSEERSSLSTMASMLLQTPTIVRKLPRSPSKESTFEFMTPQSILKVKLLKNKSPSLPSIPQQSTTISTMSPGGSDSLTSLSKVGTTFGDITSDFEHILGLLSMATPTLDSSQFKKRKGLSLSENHNVDSKNVIHTPKVESSFKSINVAESTKPEHISFTPKRLRFHGLKSPIKEPDERIFLEGLPKSLAGDKVVILRSANEEPDVDVTGDITDDVIPMSPNIQQNCDEQPLEESANSSICQPLESMQTSEEYNLSSNEVQLSPIPEEQSSTDQLHLVLDQSSESNVHQTSSEELISKPKLKEAFETNIITSTANEHASKNTEKGFPEQAIPLEKPAASTAPEEFSLYVSDSSDNDSIAISSDGEVEQEIKLEISDDENGNIKPIRDATEVDHVEASLACDAERKVSVDESKDINIPGNVILPEVEESNSPTSESANISLHLDSSDNDFEKNSGSEYLLQLSETKQTTDAMFHRDISLDDKVGGDKESTALSSPLNQSEGFVLNLHLSGNESEGLTSSGDATEQAEMSQIKPGHWQEYLTDTSKTHKMETKHEKRMSDESKDLIVSQTLISSEQLLSKDPKAVMVDNNANVRQFQSLIPEKSLICPSEEKPSLPKASPVDKVAARIILQEENESRNTTGTQEDTENDKNDLELTSTTNQLPKMPKTPTANRLFNEPVFLLSPPVNKGRQVEFQSSENRVDSIAEPHFVLSPATTRTRSSRKRTIKHESKPTTPSKRTRHSNIENDDVAGKPPIPVSSHKRRTPSRSIAPVTPTRSSARVRARSLVAEHSPRKLDKITDDNDPPVMKNTPSRKSQGVANVESAADQVQVPTHKLRSSTRKTRYSKHESDCPDEQPSVSRTSWRRKIIADTTVAHDEITSTSEYMTLESVDSDNPPTVKRTKSRRSTKDQDAPPSVTRTSSRTRKIPSELRKLDNSSSEQEETAVKRSVSKRRTKTIKKSPTASDPSVIVEQPLITRTSSRTRRTTKILDNDAISIQLSSADKTSTKRKSKDRKTKEDPDLVENLDKSTKNKPANSDDLDPPRVTRTSSRKNRVPVSRESEPDDPPAVTRTRSGRKYATKILESKEEEPTSVPRSPVRWKGKTLVRKVEVEVEDEPSLLRTSSRSQRKKFGISDDNKDTSESLDTIPVVKRTSSRTRSKAATATLRAKKGTAMPCDEPDLTPEDTIDFHKKSPSDEPINLIEVPEETTTETEKATESSKAVATTIRANFPIVARRRAKVHIYKKSF